MSAVEIVVSIALIALSAFFDQCERRFRRAFERFKRLRLPLFLLLDLQR